MPYKISGTKYETAIIIIFKESEIRTIIARNNDGWIGSYGNVIPIEE